MNAFEAIMNTFSPTSTPKNIGGRPQDSIRSMFDISDVDELGKVNVSCTLCGESWSQAGGSEESEDDKWEWFWCKRCGKAFCESCGDDLLDDVDGLCQNCLNERFKVRRRPRVHE